MKQYKAVVEAKDKKIYSIASLIFTHTFEKTREKTLIPMNYIYAKTLNLLKSKTQKDENGLWTFNSIDDVKIWLKYIETHDSFAFKCYRAKEPKRKYHIYELETSEPFESGTKKYESITPIKFNKVKQITFIKEVF